MVSPTAETTSITASGSAGQVEQRGEIESLDGSRPAGIDERLRDGEPLQLGRRSWGDRGVQRRVKVLNDVPALLTHKNEDALDL